MSGSIRYEADTLYISDPIDAKGHVIFHRYVMHATNLRPMSKLLWCFLMSYAQQRGRCWPGYERLCTDMQCSENVVRAAMKELKGVGLLSIKRRGQGKTNIYSLPDLRTADLEVQDHEIAPSQDSEPSGESLNPSDRATRSADLEGLVPQNRGGEVVRREEVISEAGRTNVRPSQRPQEKDGELQVAKLREGLDPVTRNELDSIMALPLYEPFSSKPAALRMVVGLIQDFPKVNILGEAINSAVKAEEKGIEVRSISYFNNWIRKARYDLLPRKPSSKSPASDHVEQITKILVTPTGCEPWDEMKEQIAQAGETRPAQVWGIIDRMRVKLEGDTIIAFSDVAEKTDTVSELVCKYIKNNLLEHRIEYRNPLRV